MECPVALLLPIEKAAEQAYASYRPTAGKRGRNPQWPYVPIIDHGTFTQQIRGKAYKTREEAIAYAQRWIDASRDFYRQHLALPKYRALRSQVGLPENIPHSELRTAMRVD